MIPNPKNILDDKFNDVGWANSAEYDKGVSKSMNYVNGILFSTILNFPIH